MIKFLLGLITAVTSFVGLLGIGNAALATSIVNQEIEPLSFDALEQPVSLNVCDSLWQLNNQEAKNIFDHLGCSCADCSQVVETE